MHSKTSLEQLILIRFPGLILIRLPFIDISWDIYENIFTGHTWLALCHEYITLNIVIAFCRQSDGLQHGQLFSNIFILWSKRHFHLLVHMYIGSLACDPWRGFLRSPTTRHISKGDHVRDIILFRRGSNALNVSTLIITTPMQVW